MRFRLEFHLPNGEVRVVIDHGFSGEGFGRYVERIGRAQGFFVTPTAAFRVSDLHLIEPEKE